MVERRTGAANQHSDGVNHVEESATTGVHEAVRAAHILSLLAQTLEESIRALDEGRSVPEVLCRGTAAMMGANAAAFVSIQKDVQQCSVVCWPLAEPSITLKYVTRESWVFQANRERGLSGNALWQESVALGIMRDLVGQMAFADMSLARRRGEERLAILARQNTFTAEDVWLLSLCSKPLAAIDEHALRIEGKLLRTGEQDQSVEDVAATTIPLTRREIEVLTLLHLGLKARTMGARLGVSPYTVNKHLGNIYRKLGAHDRLIAVSRAQALGLLPSGPYLES